MARLFYFEVVESEKVIFRSDYFEDDAAASWRALEIVILMGRCAPSVRFFYRVIPVEVVAGEVPDNFAL